MTSSLVGSEMCIRDRGKGTRPHRGSGWCSPHTHRRTDTHIHTPSINPGPEAGELSLTTSDPRPLWIS
eukprot:3682285-Prorocentrum_lima.AAC.1